MEKLSCFSVSAQDLNPHPVIFKVSKSVRPSLDEFHFAMKSFFSICHLTGKCLFLAVLREMSIDLHGPSLTEFTI